MGDGQSKGSRPAIRVADLAAELQLSTATVSRALNGSPAVRPEVARKVLEYARQRGYAPNWLARSLAAGSKTFVGFLVPDIHNIPYTIAADACARLLGDRGYQLILAITGDDPDREFDALAGLAGAQVATVIAAPSVHISEEARRAFTGMSVIEFNRTAGLASYGVFCADRPAFQEATRHLVTLGHRHIAYVGTTDSVSNGRERLAGVRAALAEAGLDLPAERVRLHSPTAVHGHDAVRELFRATRPTALLVGSSSLSIGAAQAIQEMGLAIPDEVSLIVYGDPDWAGLCHPGLTTIAVPYRLMAEVVADLVDEILTGPEPGPDDAGWQAERGRDPNRDSPRAKQHWLPARLINRQSTGPPPEEATAAVAAHPRTSPVRGQHKEERT